MIFGVLVATMLIRKLPIIVSSFRVHFFFRKTDSFLCFAGLNPGICIPLWAISVLVFSIKKYMFFGALQTKIKIIRVFHYKRHIFWSSPRSNTKRKLPTTVGSFRIRVLLYKIHAFLWFAD